MSDEVERTWNTDIQSGLQRSIWPVRLCIAFFLTAAASNAMLFIYQAVFYRTPFGEPYVFQAGAWIHLSGHLVRGIAAGLLAQRLLYVLKTIHDLLRSAASEEEDNIDGLITRYFLVTQIYWTTLACSLAVLVCLGITSVVAPFVPLPKFFQPRIYESSAEGPYKVEVAFYFAENEPRDDFRAAKIVETGETIYLHPEPFLTNSDISAASVIDSDDGSPAVGIKFAQRSVEKVREGTTVHKGGRLAILIDNAVIMAPVIENPLEENAMITGSFDRPEAERIAKGIVGAPDHE